MAEYAMSLGACLLVRLKTILQGCANITRYDQDLVLFTIFRHYFFVVLSKFYFFIRRHWRSTFIIYPTILYPSLTYPHHDVAVHPKSHSLLVRPLGLTAGEMYSIRATYIRTPPTPPSPTLRALYTSSH